MPRTGTAPIVSPIDSDCMLYVVDDRTEITLRAVDRDSDQRVHVTFRTEQLDELENQIRRIRQARGI